ncbi:hypothetical protein P5W99_00875 [Paraburkholderia sp. A3BS-1L]|uniref:hypothetical protein n=1 Tax=Paraburkholderia sp. A3BS-1L TaxID=3028375 RepID=UPI003DA961B8
MTSDEYEKEFESLIRKRADELGSLDAAAKEVLAIALKGLKTGTGVDGEPVTQQTIAAINRVRQLLKDRKQ